MFENMSHLALQQYWWVIISLLGSLLVFLLFVQGGQSLIYQIGKTENEKTIVINSLGRKWEFTFTTLVTFGGAFFASFPLFYATSFGGAYWAWMALLFCFIVQAVSYEYRRKPGNFLGKRTFEAFLFVNGLMGTLLIGTIVGTFFNGANFTVNEMNFSKWDSGARGLEAVLNFHNLSLGLSVFFLSRILAVLYFMNSIKNDSIYASSRKHLVINTIPFLVFFLFFIVKLLFMNGYSYDSETLTVFLEPNKYLNNLLGMPFVLLIFLIGVAAVLFGIGGSLSKERTNGIWFAGIGTVLTVFALLLTAGLNNTCYYPSSTDIQSSLNIKNSSSSKYTLTAMSYVSLLVPFVVAYIWYAWKAINRDKITEEEVTGEEENLIY